MNLNDLTIGQAREIATLFQKSEFSPPKSGLDHSWNVGANYFIRTVTHHYTGRLVAVHSMELVLEDAAWIADEGRFTQAVANAEFAEVEPYPVGKVIIGRGSLLDATEIKVLPRTQK